MNPIDVENEADSDSSSTSESLSVVSDESSTSSSSSYEDEDIRNNKEMDMTKKVKKLRSMKLAKFPSLKLITRQMRIQPDYSSLYSSGEASSEQSTALKMLSPHYMKTNSSDAKEETLQKSGKTLIKKSSFKPGKSLSRLSSTRYRNSLTRRGSGATDLKKKLKKSRSTKLLNQHSNVSSFPDTPKSLRPTNARNAQASPRDSISSLSSKNSLASSGNKSMRIMTRTSTLRPVRILTKMASLRTKKPTTKRSSEIPDPSVHRATCSSALKESKFPDHLELQPGGSESEGISAMKVCPYSYCSLHGHRHSSDLPPLKRYVSMRRRQLKSQKSTRSESWFRREKRSGSTKKGDQTNQMTDTGDALILETAHESDSVVSISEPTEEHSPLHEETNENPADDHEFNTADSGAEFSNVTSPMEKQKHMGLWRLIYMHMASGIAEAEDDSLRTRDEVDKNEVEDGNITDQSMSIEDHERGSVNSQLYQYNAIKLVQEAFDKILSEIPDQSSDDKSMDNDTPADKEASEDNHSEGEKLSTSTSSNSGGANAAQDQEGMWRTASDVDTCEGGKAEPKAESKSRQQTPKSWSNLKKVIILKRFVKSLQKVRSFIPRKPRYLPVSHGPEAEKVNLRRQDMQGRKASEEWMLDYALQQVISTLGPAQKRKVALLVRAFETVAPLPEMSNLSSNVEAPPQATPVQNCADAQDRKDNENGKEIKFGVLLRKTPRRDLNIKKDQDEVSEFYTVEHNPVSCSDINEAIARSNLTAVDSLASNTAARDDREEVAAPPYKNSNNNSFKYVQAEFADSDSMKIEPKLCHQSSSKSADSRITSSDEFSVNTEVIKEIVGEIMPASEDHECGLSSHNEEPRHFSSCTDQSAEMNSHNLSNADALSSASGSALQGRSSEATVGETKIRNKILQRFGDLLEESKSMKTTGAELEKQLQKQKNMRLWFMIYKHMASDTTTPLEEAGKDDTENDSSTMVGMQDAPSHDASSLNNNPVDQKIKLQQIEAIRMVEEAIDGIQLPGNQDDSPDDQSVTSDITPDTAHLEKEFVQDEEPLVAIPTGSIKEEDRIKLDVKGTSLDSPNVIYEEKSESLKKTGNEASPSMKNWSNLKKLILLRRFVKSLEKVNKFAPRGPKFLPVEPDKEAEKVNLRHQDVDDRKNADEWMLDYALRQVVVKLTPARKRKVELLVEAFETVIPTIEN